MLRVGALQRLSMILALMLDHDWQVRAATRGRRAVISRFDFCNDTSHFELDLAEHAAAVQCQKNRRPARDCLPYEQICTCNEQEPNDVFFSVSCRSYIVNFPEIYFYTETVRMELAADASADGIYRPVAFEVCESITNDSELQCLDVNEDMFYVLPVGLACNLRSNTTERCFAETSAHMESMVEDTSLLFPIITKIFDHPPATSEATLGSFVVPFSMLVSCFATASMMYWTTSGLGSRSGS